MSGGTAGFSGRAEGCHPLSQRKELCRSRAAENFHFRMSKLLRNQSDWSAGLSGNGKPYPAFNLSVSGSDSLYQERFGNIAGVILEEDMCLFLAAIADAVTAAGTDFNTWLEKEKEQLDAILNTYLK